MFGVFFDWSNKLSRSLIWTLVFVLSLVFSFDRAEAAPIKILSNSSHAAGNISSTITQLLGRAFTSDEFVIHMTSNDSTYAGSSANAALASTTRYTLSGVATTSQAPYNVYTSSFTGYPGESISEYNISVSNDVVNNYAYSANPVRPPLSPPPAFFVTPGITSYPSGGGVEWRLDQTIFCSSSLSCLTAANAGMMSVLRWLHSTSTPAWNWFDVKAALRQTGANWATGYDRTAYGFGQVNYTTANALTSSQILLQPPAVATSTMGLSSQITFTVYPFKQTRRVKEVLFQFSSAPTFQANELTLSQIETLGGTKVTEYSGTSATTSAPTYATTTNAYFVWLTADNATDSAASFSRIDTYTILGPLSQGRIEYNNTFNIATPISNTISSTQSPTFTWGAADSYFGISKYQLFVDGVLNKDNISGTSATPTENLSAGAHTWYVKAVNGNGVATTTQSTATVNIIPDYAAGYTFYVDNVLGSDSNPGTQALPWATLTKAADTVLAGDIVIVIKNAGVPYRETLTPINDGTSSLRITFRGVDMNNKPEIWGSADVSSGWSVYGGGGANTYQYATTTSVQVLAVGPTISTLSKKTLGASAATLNPGEWYWASNVLYYRLGAGEVMGSIHIEASMRDAGISSSLAQYITFKDIVVRYANDYSGIYLSSSYQVAQGVEVYDCSQGIYMTGTGSTIQYAIAAGNNTTGIDVAYPSAGKVYNSLSYGNGTNGISFSMYAGRSATLKNNIASGNTDPSFAFAWIFSVPTMTTSHNLWDVAGDSNWTNTYKGTNNQELINPLLIAAGSRNFALTPLSPAIDTGTAISGLTTDILGNPIYGTPDIGPYEYQPPYTIGTHDIDITGSVRLYKNGRYRYTSATTTGTTASFNVTPVGGFPAGDYSEFMNVSISKWNKTGDYSKTWTESSTAATSTAHTIGNLKANTYYTVSVDGTSYVSMLTNGSGQGTFTYTGGYSTHTFSVDEDTVAPAAPASGATGNVSGGGTQTFTWASTSDISGLSKYQLFVDGALQEDNIATTSTQTTATSFSCGNHTWYARAVDNAGNGTDSSLQSFNIICEGSGAFTGPVSSLPGYVAPRLQTITPDGKVVYLDERAIAPAPVSAPIAIAAVATPTIPAPIFTRTLKRGARGGDVPTLQEFLKKDSSIYPEGVVNGIFGPATERAVKRFQKKYDLVSSGTPQTTGYGVVGPKTRMKLNELQK